MYRQSSFFFLALIGLVLLGFSKTYFFRLDESLPLFVHLHVLFVGGWVLLITGQAFLIRTGQRAVHRHLGDLGFVLAPAIIISGVYLSRAHFDQRLGSIGLSNNLEFLWWSLSHFLLFGLFFSLAIANRKTAILHARYMIVATLLFVPPTLLRVFDQLGLRVGELSSLNSAFIVTDLMLLALLVHDLRHGNPRLPFAAGLGAFLLVQLATPLAGESTLWASLANWIV